MVGFLDFFSCCSFFTGIFWPFFVPVERRSLPRLAFLIRIGFRRRFLSAMPASCNGSFCVCDTEVMTLISKLAIAVAGAAVVLTGCSVPVAGEASAASSAPTTTRSAYTPPIYTPPAAQQTSSNIGALGVDTFTYADGLAVSVSKPEVYTPGKYSAGNDFPVAVRLVVTVTNNSSKAFDPTLFQVDASFGGQSASRIFDSANDIGSAPQTQVLPGKSISFPVAFSIIEGGGELQVDTTPSWSHNSSVFIGPIG